MTSLTILCVYVIGIVITFRRMIPIMLGRLDRAAEKWEYEDLREQTRREDRSGYLGVAFLFSLSWLFTLPAMGFWRLLLAGVDTRTPVEITQQEREELEQLRRLARKHDLPMGD